MKPTPQLLRPPRAPRPATPPASIAVQERDALLARKDRIERDRETLQAAAGALPKRLDDLVAALRRDSQDRPAAIPGAVAIRVLGAMHDDKKLVPLPNLRVTLTAGNEPPLHAITDVTGFAMLSAPRPPPAEGPSAPSGVPNYRLTITASDGSDVAHADADPTLTHLFMLGDAKGLEAHAVLGRGWVAALDRAAALRTEVVKRATADVANLDQLAMKRLDAITRRLAMHHEK